MQCRLRTALIIGATILLSSHAQRNQTDFQNTASSVASTASISTTILLKKTLNQNSTNLAKHLSKDITGYKEVNTSLSLNTPTQNVSVSSITESSSMINTIASNHCDNRRTRNMLQSKPCICNEDKYKTGIIICIIIIGVLVLVCAILIISCVVLANKVSRLKTKLTQSKRQARSNGDFLSASSILWSSGMETWQKKSQTATLKMEEISLNDTNTSQDEKNQLMLSSTENAKNSKEDKSISLDNEHSLPSNYVVEI
ncbi:protein EVI2A [Xenopus laevis]|uniref:Protein EVI2A n=2 Tax=Xenopus laevis TaxID=8355 RepID=A0A1L8H8D3_XENLA|nr:protein EVI2A [Xenopus laevis]OCT92367.1 hypothetical protein XELAEV_18015427mg [Xenopus laevis]